ncbi:MAG: DUF1631 family protein [Pseudomonadales bacterium]|nr:DUF1631 family protein [Pseudomonadales bacterium]MCP5183751.1 DUF1631 family protein [Pseudomonadales bacterium]
MNQSQRERRREERIQVSLDALVHFSGGTSWECTIRDFCRGGVFLRGEAAALRRAVGDAEGDTALEIHFTLDDGGRAKHYQVSGVAVRRLEDSLGVHIPDGMGADELAALHRQASGNGEIAQASDEAISALIGSASISAGKSRKIAAACAKASETALGRMIDEALQLFDVEIGACERRASSIAEREAYQHALRTLPKVDKSIRQQFVARVADLLRNMKVPPMFDGAESEAASSGGQRLLGQTHLALVEKSDFEQWLVVAETVSALEGDLQEEIFILRSWFGILQSGWKNKDQNPICPSMLARTFKQSLLTLGFREEVIRVAFASFERIARSRLGAFYDKLIASLEKTGLFPSIQSIIAEQVKNSTPVRLVAVSGSGSGDAGNGSGGAGQANGGGSGAGGNSAIARMMDLAAEVGGRASAADEGEEVAVELVIKQLARLRNKQMLSDERSGGGTLKALLLQQLSASGMPAGKLPGKTERALDIVDYMVDGVQEDAVLSPELRALVAKLELTLGMEALRDESLVNASPAEHPAFQMLNHLESVDGGEQPGDSAAGGVHQQVSAIISRLISDWDSNRSAFAEAAEQLTPLVERQKKVYARNLERVVSGCEGRSRLKRARQLVLKRLAELLENRQVPTVLVDVVNPAWRNLLVNTALKHGTRSIEWKQQLRVIQRILRRCDELQDGSAVSADEGSVSVLLKSVEEGLRGIGAPVSEGVLERVSTVLRNGMPAADATWVEAGALVRSFAWQDVLPSADPMPPVGDERQRRTWLENLRRTRVLNLGTHVRFAVDGSEDVVSTLAWVDGAGERFVFVNRRGLWDRELSLEDFTRLLTEGNAQILEGYEVPLLQRVSERMMNRVHKGLTDRSRQDELTALGNRKAYERELDKLLELSRQLDVSHCVLQVNVDRFRILNDTCGFDGGDTALKQIARLIESQMSGHDAFIARIGVDEFGVVLNDTSVGEGADLAESIERAVRALDFAWKGQRCAITVTVGVVGIDRATENVRNTLQNLASACRSGKEQGGGRVSIYTEDDVAMQEQRAVMHLASQVERYLQQGRVHLNAQLIAPADPGGSLLPHYEILITVEDDDGKRGSPVKFIEAAERYGKMPMVDRHIVARTLDWMGQHPEALEGLSGLSINLSGQSVNQEDFLGFVLDQFKQSNAAPDKVCFEITETAAIGNLFQATEFIRKIKVMGCRFSLDDFGAGMSSFGYLRQLPVDYLKIDGSFVKNMANDENDLAVVRSMNEIGHFMGKRTVAEYVHDDATRDAACAINIDYLQGWGVEKPKPIDELLKPADRAVKTSA